ncbi:hypothetical protein CIHG_08676, partial [Coccidioides immitis H538.4]
TANAIQSNPTKNLRWGQSEEIDGTPPPCLDLHRPSLVVLRPSFLTLATLACLADVEKQERTLIPSCDEELAGAIAPILYRRGIARLADIFTLNVGIEFVSLI